MGRGVESAVFSCQIADACSGQLRVQLPPSRTLLRSKLAPMLDAIAIRCAISSEREALEALQRRASLANAGDRDGILAHPDAIEVSVRQLESGQVYVAEWDGTIVGFAAILAREDGDTELDAIF